MNKKTKLIATISVIAVVVLAIVLFFVYMFTEKTSPDVSEEEIKTKVEDINDKFTTLSKEMLENDGKTIKSDYSEDQKKLFNAAMAKVSEMDTIMTTGKKELEEQLAEKESSFYDALRDYLGLDPRISDEENEYYTTLSNKVDEIQKIITVLYNDLHTNKADFKTTFTNLIELFTKFTEVAVSGDKVTLLDQYKDYQSEFDELLKDITEIAKLADTDNANQEYYDKLAEKGKELTEKLKDLANKANIPL